MGLKKIFWMSGLVLAVVLVSLVWLHRLEERKWYAGAASTGAGPIAVGVEKVGTGPLCRRVMAEGYAEAVRKSYLQFEAPGKVLFIGRDGQGRELREGSKVRGPGPGMPRGQLLARVDARDELADLVQRRAALVEAEKDLSVQRAALDLAMRDMDRAGREHERSKSLFEKNYLARSDYDRAEHDHARAVSAVTVARLNLASAQARLDRVRAEVEKAGRAPERLELYAPFDGVIARINIEAGDYFEPSDVEHSHRARLSETAPIIVMDPSSMEVDLHLPLFDGRLVRVGQRVEVSPGFEGWAAGRERADAPGVAGVVHSVSPQVDHGRRAVRVKVRVDRPGGIITDGMFTSCWITVDSRPDALRVPLSCIRYRRGEPFVFVVRGGVAVRRMVGTGIVDGRFMEIESGLEPGEFVVARGAGKLAQGMAVAAIADGPDQGAGHGR